MAEITQNLELLDLTIDNITPNTIRINNQGKNERLKYLLERLVTHLHDFARETRLSTEEWMAALMFLTQAGQICSDVRQVSCSVSRRPCVRPHGTLVADSAIVVGIHPPLRHPRPVAADR